MKKRHQLVTWGYRLVERMLQLIKKYNCTEEQLHASRIEKIKKRQMPANSIGALSVWNFHWPKRPSKTRSRGKSSMSFNLKSWITFRMVITLDGGKSRKYSAQRILFGDFKINRWQLKQQRLKSMMKARPLSVFVGVESAGATLMAGR